MDINSNSSKASAGSTTNQKEIAMNMQCIAIKSNGNQCSNKPKQYTGFNSVFCGPHENIVTAGATINTINGQFNAADEIASLVVSSVCVAITSTSKEIAIIVPSTASAVQSAKADKKEENGIERFFADEMPGHYLLEDLDMGRVEFIFIDLKVHSAKAVDGNPSPLDVIVSDFAPTWGNVRGGFYRGVRVGEMAWGTLPFDIQAELSDFVDGEGNVKASSIGKVLKHQSCYFAPSGAHLVQKNADVKIGLIEEIMTITNPKHVDGAMVFSKKFWAKMIKNSIAAIALDDPFLEERIARLNEATCAIVRVITPNGMHKGLAIKAKKSLGGFEVVSSDENFKKNIKSEDGNVYVWAEPHVPHSDDVAVDPGSMMAHPFFFQEKDMIADMDNMFAKLTTKVEKGNVSPVRGNLTNDGILSYQERFNKVVEAGLSISDTPFLFSAFCNGIYLGAAQERRWKMNYMDEEFTFPRYDKMRWAVRGSVRLQVVSTTWAKVAGLMKFSDEVAEGAVRIVDGMGIVCDATFALNYELHGGWDLDDKMILVAFEDIATGTTRLFGYRQPSSWGEFAVYNVDAGSNQSEVPKSFRTLDSSTFPVIDVAAAMIAKVEKKKLTGKGWVLPSKFYKSVKVATVALTNAMLMEEALRAVDNPLGKYIKVIGVFYAMRKAVPCAQLGTHEDVVDAMTQASAAMDFDMVTKATENILAQLLHETKGQIDKGLIGRITQSAKFVEKNSIIQVDGKFIRLGSYFKAHLDTFKAMCATLYAAHQAVLMSKVAKKTQDGITIKHQAAPVDKAYKDAFAATPKSVTKIKVIHERVIVEEKYSYEDLQNISNTVADSVAHMSDMELAWVIGAYLHHYTNADKTMSNGRMLDRYISFVSLVTNLAARRAMRAMMAE